MNSVDFEILLGKTLSNIAINTRKDEVTFVTSEGQSFLMYHEHECCERVSIEDIVGEIDDLIGSPLTMVEEVLSSEDPPNCKLKSEFRDDRWAWTFYKMATVKGFVTIRWYG